MIRMKRFPYGHATHPDWRMAVSLVVAQIRGRMAQSGYARNPSLGVAYFSDAFASHAEALLEALQDEFPEVSDWSGAVGAGVMATRAEYLTEPALAVMLLDLPRHAYRVFSGIAPLRSEGGVPHGASAALSSTWQQALVHADANLPDLPDLLQELAARTGAGQLLGGLCSGSAPPLQLAWSKALEPRHSGVFHGGISGLAFGADAAALQSVTQGCQPIGGRMRITALQDNVLLSLDGRPALEVLEEIMLVRMDTHPELATRKMRNMQVALENIDHPQSVYEGQLPPQARVCSLLGVDTRRGGIVLPESALEQKYLRFCQRNWTAARADLLRMCAELRESLAPANGQPLLAGGSQLSVEAEGVPEAVQERAIAGAIYISCTGRGGGYFGAENGELELLHHVLGDIPLIGFFSQGEIAGQQLHRYSGALLVFTQEV